ncbi:hypothetical protein ACQKGC_02145 [Allorhizobium pseudoryzae]|uniref:hypothetical protein n=1 Tax=Allorhizobium pseudoryzae TaxID=379684 RepID=UPI003D05329D
MPGFPLRANLRTLIVSGTLAGALCLPVEALALSGNVSPPPERSDIQHTAPTAQTQLPRPGSPSVSAEGTAPAASDTAQPKVEILHDLSKLPEPVKAMRQALTEAAASGDVERLRPLMAFDDDVMEQLKADGGDPVASFKSLSGDPQGLEILAIMLDILQTGAAHVGIGTPDEMYVWPYFVGKPITQLSAPERVELLRIITAGDLDVMAETNNYNFYRIGITVDGKWRLFAGGD